MTNKKVPCILLLISTALFAVLCILLHTMPDRMIGAAFCHQLAARSPAHNFPFCFRCSGLFSGVFFGSIYYLLISRSKKLLAKKSILLFAAGLTLFAADILNTTPLLAINWYPEKAEIRFLSAFPMGFFLSGIVVPALHYFTLKHESPQQKWYYEILWLLFGWGISYLLIFGNVRFLLEAARVLVCAGSVLFLTVCYCILIHCIAVLRHREISLRTAICCAVFLALLQIDLFGFLHIRLIPFEQLLQ